MHEDWLLSVTFPIPSPVRTRIYWRTSRGVNTKGVHSMVSLLSGCGTSRESASAPLKTCRSCSTTNIGPGDRSEEHTSELQSRENIVCRLLLEKKKIKPNDRYMGMGE